MYVPRAAKWNLSELCPEFLKDIDTSEYEFSEYFITGYTNQERQILNRISRRLNEEGNVAKMVKEKQGANETPTEEKEEEPADKHDW